MYNLNLNAHYVVVKHIIFFYLYTSRLYLYETIMFFHPICIESLLPNWSNKSNFLINILAVLNFFKLLLTKYK